MPELPWAADAARLALSLAAVAVLSTLLVVEMMDRRTRETAAHLALCLSLALISGDSLLRWEQREPFVWHLFLSRLGIVLLAGWYTAGRLRQARPGA